MQPLQDHLRNGRVTLFVTSKDILVSTRQNCTQIKTLLQSKCNEKGLSCHEIDVGLEANATLKDGIKRYFSNTYELPQVFFGARWIGGFSDVIRMVNDGRIDALLDEMNAEDGLQISFRDLEIRKGANGRPVRLGVGAAGQVFAGDWNGIPCAIKQFHITHEQEADFMREMTLLQRLRHPHIVNFYGAVVSGSHPDLGHSQCLITELCRASIFKLLQHHGKRRDDKGRLKLPLSTRLQYAHDAAQGMAFLHSKKIVHRDLKSANLLLTNDKRVVVCDFTLSRVTGQMLTRTHEGTTGFIAVCVVSSICMFCVICFVAQLLSPFESSSCAICHCSQKLLLVSQLRPLATSIRLPWSCTSCSPANRHSQTSHSIWTRGCERNS